MVVVAPRNCHLRWGVSQSAAAAAAAAEDGRDKASGVAWTTTTTTWNNFAARGADTCQRHRGSSISTRRAGSKGLMMTASHVPSGMGVGTSSLPRGLSPLSSRGIATSHDPHVHLLAGSRATHACSVPRVTPSATCRRRCRHRWRPIKPAPWSAVSSASGSHTRWTGQPRRRGRGGRDRAEVGGGGGTYMPVPECWKQMWVWGDKSASSSGPAVGIVMSIRASDRGLLPAKTKGFQDGSPASQPGRGPRWLTWRSGARFGCGSGFSGEDRNSNCPTAVAGDGSHASVQADGVDPGRTVDGIATTQGVVAVNDGVIRKATPSGDDVRVCDGLGGDASHTMNPMSQTASSPAGSSFAAPCPVPGPISAAAPASAGAASYSFPDRPTDPRLRAIEDFVEKTIFDFRFFTLLGVLGSLTGSVLCFAKGCFFICRGFKEYYATCLSGVHTGKVILLLIEAVDVFLVGTVMLIFGMGLYELFITNVPATVPVNMDRALNTSTLFGMFRLRERPRWMKIQSLDELKTKLGHVIVMILLVNMFEKAKMVEVASATDLVFFSLSVLMSAGSLYLLNRLHQ
ncbi:hypothetical protein CBR_g12790 [Chara braunii]|uniref:Uncharacterized protein n=1 Tax=Chara braunii TaxID=69332 RepID=A0A388KSN9_CHABU|nr:hypothetical protein CBR_g12790 [Chara braunii]|eukprot:GBG73074.1 hypothetical protein CBR_g12790 [Chara braunii]